MYIPIFSNPKLECLQHVCVYIVTDNGSQFTSDEFQTYLRKNGIHHTCTAPGHPATNGLAEKYVGHFKSKMKILDNEPGQLHAKLQRFLFTHRTTPLANGKSPAELLLNRQPRTRFDLLKGESKKEVEIYEKNSAFEAGFISGQALYALDFTKNSAKWVPCVVTDVLSPMSYRVQVGDVNWKRHRNQLRTREIPTRSDIQVQSPCEPSPTIIVSDTVARNVPSPVADVPQQPDLPVVPEKSSVSIVSQKCNESTVSDRPRRSAGMPARYKT